MLIQQRLRGIFKTAKNNDKGLTLIEFSIVIAMTIALIGLVLQATGVFGLVDKYYLKTKVQHAMMNYGASDGTTLQDASGDGAAGWLEGGLMGTVDANTIGVAFTEKEMKACCRLQKKSGQLNKKKRSTDLLYNQIFNGSAIDMGNTTDPATSICDVA